MRSPYEPSETAPTLSLEYHEWMEDAKCAQTVPNSKPPQPIYNPDMWYPPRDKALYKPIADVAKAVCYGRDGAGECPVRMQCLLYADKDESVHGIWGGMSHRERAALKRKAQKQGTTLEALAKNLK